MLALHFGNSVHDNSDWDKISHSLTKKYKKKTNKKTQHFEQLGTHFGMKKKRKANPLTQTLV